MKIRKTGICLLLTAMLAAQTSCEIDGGIIGFIKDFDGKMADMDEPVPEQPVYSELVPAKLCADYDWAVSNAPDFTVSNAEELISAAYWVNHICEENKWTTVTLTSDIDLSQYLWEPFGSGQGKSFCGEVDGGGHTITGLTIRDSQYDTGFIGNAAPLTTVHDISFTGASVQGGANTGIVCGESYDSSEWYNIHVSGSIATDALADYGAIGGRTPHLTFRDCTADVTVNGQPFSYLTWQQYCDENNPHINEYTLTYDNASATVSRTSRDKEAENLCWVISRNGKRVLGRGCEDEYSVDPNSFDLVGGSSGLYSVYLEAFYSGSYLQCSNVIEYEIVPQGWPGCGGDKYPLCTSDPFEIGFGTDNPNKIVCNDGSADAGSFESLHWVLLINGEKGDETPFSEDETAGLTRMMFEAGAGDKLKKGVNTVHVFVAGQRADGTLERVSNVLEQLVDNYGNESPTVYVDGIDADDDPSAYSASLAADDLANEPDFLAKMAILTPTGDTWHAVPAEGTEGYSYGDREGDTSAFHIVTDTGGNMFCIGKDDSYENGHKVQWVLLFNGREKYTEPYFDNADAVQQGAFAPFLSIAPEEGIYSVYITDTVSGVSERISNILEFRVKK